MAFESAQGTIRSADELARRHTGMNLWRWLTLGSVGAAVALFATGKKNLALLVGTAPATLSAFRHH
jgi:hypothetical protein